MNKLGEPADEQSLVSLAHEHGLVARMTASVFRPGEAIFTEGDCGGTFFLLDEGVAEISHGATPVDRVGPGSILGELSLLTGDPRNTTVRASTTVRGWSGDVAVFDAMLQVEGLRRFLNGIVGTRLASNLEPIRFQTTKGFAGHLRPLLPSDRDQYLKSMSSFSPQAKRLRFFTAGDPSPALIDYLLAVDQLNHFAWVALDTGAGGQEMSGVAIGRFIRSADGSSADTAFAVDEKCHGRGIATFMLGALAVGAQEIGITTFTAEVLMENAPMRKVFARAGAKWVASEPGIVGASVEVERASQLIDPVLASTIKYRMRSLRIANETLLAASIS